MDHDPSAEIAEFIAALDPDAIFRAIALTLAVQSDTSKDHEKIMAKAAAYHEFIDPFSDTNEPKLTYKIEPRG